MKSMKRPILHSSSSSSSMGEEITVIPHFTPVIVTPDKSLQIKKADMKTSNTQKEDLRQFGFRKESKILLQKEAFAQEEKHRNGDTYPPRQCKSHEFAIKKRLSSLYSSIKSYKMTVGQITFSRGPWRSDAASFW